MEKCLKLSVSSILTKKIEIILTELRVEKHVICQLPIKLQTGPP